MDNIEFAFDHRLDTVFLNALYGGNIEHISTVFGHFLNGIHNQLKEVEENFNSGNIELFRKKVHKLKPVFSFVGLTTLTDKAQLIESQCKNYTSTDPLREQYQDFKNDIFELIPVIENELVKLKN